MPEPPEPAVRVLDSHDIALAARALAFTVRFEGILSAFASELVEIDPGDLADMADLYARLTGEFD